MPNISMLPYGSASSGGNRPWENSNNITNITPSVAKVTLNRSGHVADMIRGTFRSITIDPRADITGLEFEIARKQSGDFAIKDKVVQIFIGGSPVGQNKSKLERWTSNMDVVTYGGSDDLWGLQVSDLFTNNVLINNLQIGVDVETPDGKSDAVDLSIQYMKVTIYYRISGVTVKHEGVIKKTEVNVMYNGEWKTSDKNYIMINGEWRVLSTD